MRKDLEVCAVELILCPGGKRLLPKACLSGHVESSPTE
jgi:hypothetical protein